MEDLRLVGVHDDGAHLVLSGPEGRRYRVAVDDRLRSAVRVDRRPPKAAREPADGDLRPRDVQALIRAGATAQEAAERAGWSLDKVRRYEGPILAEREYVAGLARADRLRGRGGVAPTLSARVAERLSGRGVDPLVATWDAFRSEEGPWTVVVTFQAGGRQRQAAWRYDPAEHSLLAADDEARWLSEDDEASPLLDRSVVYDQEAEGAAERRSSGPHRTAAAAPSGAGAETSGDQDRGGEPVDLMTAMRERSTARERGRGRRTGRGPGTDAAGQSLPGLPARDGREDGRGASPGAPDRADLVPSGSPVATRGDGTAPSETSAAGSAPPSGAPDAPAPPEAGRRRARPSVPTWDDIMFGARTPER